jgi:hypothetical protein
LHNFHGNITKRFIEINKINELTTQKEYFSIVLSLLIFRNNLLTVHYSKKGEGEHLNCEEQNSKTEDSEQRGV